MALLCFGYYAAVHMLTLQRAAQCNGILLSILEFPIKTTLQYMKLLLHASTQIQLVFAYLYFQFFLRSLPIDLPTVPSTYTTRKGICTYGYEIGHTVYVYRTYNNLIVHICT